MQGGEVRGRVDHRHPSRRRPRGSANPYVDLPICTGIMYARNMVVVKTGRAVIAIDGSFGTMSEIGHALAEDIPVIGLDTWSFSIESEDEVEDPIIRADGPGGRRREGHSGGEGAEDADLQSSKAHLTFIADIRAREILDSRGIPTVEAEARLTDGTGGVAAVPSGASVGAYEALELRDNDPRRFGGRGVLKAIDNIHNRIVPALRGRSPFNQSEVDGLLLELDGTSQ